MFSTLGWSTNVRQWEAAGAAQLNRLRAERGDGGGRNEREGREGRRGEVLMAEEKSCRVSQGDEHAAVSRVLGLNRRTAKQRGRMDEKRKGKKQNI